MAYKDKAQQAANHKRYAEEHPFKVWASATLSDHKKKGIDIHMTTQELEAIAMHVTNCEYCGCKIVYRNKGGQCEQSATLDRVNNENVVRFDNIRIVCNSCNATKRTRTFREFIQYCKMVADKFDVEVEE
jgi:hypothetical protein